MVILVNLSKKALNVSPSSTLKIAAKVKELKSQGVDIISFTVGEPDFDTPDCVNEAAIEAIKKGFTKYTDSSGIVELRKEICEKLKKDNGLSYNPSQIVVSNGAKHSLANIFAAILNEGDEVIIFAPYWLSYPEMVSLASGVPVIVYTDAENEFVPTKEQLEKALTDKTKAIIFNSPCNPTGGIYGIETLEMIAKFAVDNDLIVISDEIYEKLVYDESDKHISIASLNEDIFKRTIVVNGMSKAYAMTGWRIGYSAASQEIASVISNLQSHLASNPNSIAQMAALSALRYADASIEEMRKQFAARRDYMHSRVKEFPLVSAVKPRGAFYVFIDASELCGTTIDGVEISDATVLGEVILSKTNVAVVPCADFGFKNHIRLSYATSMENIKEGLDRLEAFINENYKG